MASLEGYSTNKSPLFIGTNYAFWKIRMRTYIMSRGIEFWAAVELGYAPKESESDKDAKLDFVANAKAMNALLIGLCEAEFIKLMHNKKYGYIRKHP